MFLSIEILRRENGTHDITDESIACFGQILYKFCVEFVVSVPWTACERNRGLDAFEHVNFTRDVLLIIVIFEKRAMKYVSTLTWTEGTRLIRRF